MYPFSIKKLWLDIHKNENQGGGLIKFWRIIKIDFLGLKNESSTFPQIFISMNNKVVVNDLSCKIYRVISILNSKYSYTMGSFLAEVFPISILQYLLPRDKRGIVWRWNNRKIYWIKMLSLLITWRKFDTFDSKHLENWDLRT